MKNILIFLAGGAVGAGIAAKLVEKYYIDAANQEIESVVNYYKEKFKEFEKNNEKGSEIKKVENGKTEKKTTPKKDKVKEIIKSEEYVSDDDVVESPIESITGIEVIDPMEYGEEDGFDTKSWMWWADDVLTDEHDQIVEDPEQFIGDALTHFGDIEEDSVYVRNRANNTDYEILRSEKEFNA